VNISFGTTKYESYKRITKVTLGAGLYNNQGVNSFKEFEKRHQGALVGTINWSGQKKTFEYTIELDNKGNATYQGPWDTLGGNP
jgi:hypothetical protein